MVLAVKQFILFWIAAFIPILAIAQAPQSIPKLDMNNMFFLGTHMIPIETIGFKNVPWKEIQVLGSIYGDASDYVVRHVSGDHIIISSPSNLFELSAKKIKDQIHVTGAIVDEHNVKNVIDYRISATSTGYSIKGNLGLCKQADYTIEIIPNGFNVSGELCVPWKKSSFVNTGRLLIASGSMQTGSTRFNIKQYQVVKQENEIHISGGEPAPFPFNRYDLSLDFTAKLILKTTPSAKPDVRNQIRELLKHIDLVYFTSSSSSLFPNEKLFKPDYAPYIRKLASDNRKTLNAVVENLRRLQSVSIELSGFTDQLVTNQSMDELSQQRIHSVYRYLSDRIDTSRVAKKSMKSTIVEKIDPIHGNRYVSIRYTTQLAK